MINYFKGLHLCIGIPLSPLPRLMYNLVSKKKKTAEYFGTHIFVLTLIVVIKDVRHKKTLLLSLFKRVNIQINKLIGSIATIPLFGFYFFSFRTAFISA